MSERPGEPPDEPFGPFASLAPVADLRADARRLGLLAEDFLLKPRTSKPAASTLPSTIAAPTATKAAGLTVSQGFPKYYDHAGCDREELFADDAERMPLNFHGLRHTALTHWAVAGRSVPWLLSAAGHTNVAMATRYVDGAAVLRATFGQRRTAGAEVAGSARIDSPDSRPVRKQSDPADAVVIAALEGLLASLKATPPGERAAALRELGQAASKLAADVAGEADEVKVVVGAGRRS